jgi:fibro-slime domain-containing protein
MICTTAGSAPCSACPRAGVAISVLLLLAGLGCAGVGAQPSGGGGAGGLGVDGGASDVGIVLPVIDGARDLSFELGPPGDAGVCQRDLRVVVRDFRSGEKDGQPKHPDFEGKVAIDPGIVAATLGADQKPVYAGGTQGTTTTKENFDQWYRDVPGINMTFEKTIPLTPDLARPGVWVFDSDAFYPLGNDEGWGNQYLDHNQDFTTEIHVSFPYKGGETFTFRGDDDLFLFVNGHLAVDLGGVHDALTGTIDLDARAAELGLQIGRTYQMDIFQAERHCCQSTFHLETTLSCINNIIVD